MKTYFIESLGCAKNLVDSEAFAFILEEAGWEEAGVPEEADLVLVNTCSFLEEALAELDMVLGDLAFLKQQHLIGKLVVTGCVMNRGLEIFCGLYPEVDEWIGLKDFEAFGKWLGLEGGPSAGRIPLQSGFHRYLRISDGCDNDCSYCAIPSIRGRMRSVPIEELVREAESLAQDGDWQFQELVVIAQDTANYGLDIYGRKALPELLEKLAELPQYRWIRVMYMHPDHFESAWLRLWQEHPKLLPYFEIPVQHSEEHILKAMNRKRKGDELVDMFDTILSEVPGAVLRTTLISGFPGETRSDALSLRKFIERVPFLHLGVFLYSPEEGTPAAGMPVQVSQATAQRRANKLLQVQQFRARELLEAYVGRTVDVLIEERSDEEDEVYVGRAWFQAPEIDGVTIVHGKGIQPGGIWPVLVTDVIDADLFGEVI